MQPVTVFTANEGGRICLPWFSQSFGDKNVFCLIFTHLFGCVLKEVLQAADNNDNDAYADVSVWDFGGQFVFYTTHQMFLSRRAIYILVNNISQHIGDVVIDDEPYFDCNGSKSLKIEGKDCK